MYINEDIQFRVLKTSGQDFFEILWVLLPSLEMKLFVVYVPPHYLRSEELSGHITSCIDDLTLGFPKVRFVLCGDFNHFDLSDAVC